MTPQIYLGLDILMWSRSQVEKYCSTVYAVDEAKILDSAYTALCFTPKIAIS